ncbi:hypothetical protein [Janthinobacterium tructae]
MYIFDIVTPGQFLVNDDKDWCWEIYTILQQMQSQYFMCHAALNLFIEKRSAPENRDFAKEREEESFRYRQIRLELRQAKWPSGEGATQEEVDKIDFEARIICKRERWIAGYEPRMFTQDHSFIYAYSFLQSATAFSNLLTVLCKKKNVPETVLALKTKMVEFFPDLQEVRNSVQHVEDRVRGLGRNEKTPLQIKPGPYGSEKAERGPLVLSSLNNDVFSNTMADGGFGSVEISQRSMEHLQSIFQATLQAFTWDGPPRHLPH